MDVNLKHYTDECFQMHVPWKPDYALVTDWIARNIPGETFGDVGCGNGFLIEGLQNRYGKKVWGVDGSEAFMRNVDPSIRDRVKAVDLTVPQKLDQADAVICLEVAEHIAYEHSDILVENI